MERSFRAVTFGVIVLIFMVEASIVAFAGGKQKVVVRPGARSIPMNATTSGELSVSVVSLAASAPLPGAAKGSEVLNLGTVSYAGAHNANVTVEQHKSSFIVITTFGLLVKDSSSHAGFATVSAFVAGANTQLTYSVDGRKLSSTPTVVVPQATVGGVSRHRLEVEIPNSLTERSAEQQVALQFEVMAN
jgi:hypothetical protein